MITTLLTPTPRGIIEHRLIPVASGNLFERRWYIAGALVIGLSARKPELSKKVKIDR